MTPQPSIRFSPTYLRLREAATVGATRRANELKQSGRDILVISGGQPDFDTPQHIKDAAMAAIERGFTKYTATDGMPELKAAIVAKMARDYRTKVQPNQVVVGTGGKQVIFNALLFSMSTENFLLAFGRGLPVWCVAGALGWIFIPVMGANMDALLRLSIPVEMQGRVYAARNALQFFTIPIGYGLGGWLVDRVFEPFMAAQPAGGWLHAVFGAGAGTGAALLFFVIGVLGARSCLPFRADRAIWGLEAPDTPSGTGKTPRPTVD